jgi:OOP family OmpA-OmpF porin
MMLKKILPLTLLAMSSAANAGGFMGVGFGESSVDGKSYFSADTITSMTDSDTSFKLFGGYAFNSNFTLEGGYASFGEYDADYVVASSESIEVTALYVAVMGSIPLGPVSLFGKAGLAHWFVDRSDSGGFNWWSEDATGIDPMFGAGVKIEASGNFALRAEFERFLDVGDRNDTGRSDIDVLSLSGVFTF